MQVKPDEFRARCMITPLGGYFACLGVKVTRLGPTKYKVGNRKGNWRQAYEATMAALASC